MERITKQIAVSRASEFAALFAAAIFVAALLLPAGAQADFGVASFAVTSREADGTIDEAAASHPYELDVHLEMNSASGELDGNLRRLRIALPPGLIGNPLATPRCPLADFEQDVPRCLGSTQVGILAGTLVGVGEITAPLYNLVPSAGYAAAFGMKVNGEAVIEQLSLVGAGAASFVRFNAMIPPGLDIVGVDQLIWGVPAAQGHDSERTCIEASGPAEGCSAGIRPVPLLTLPSSCSVPLETTLSAFSALGSMADAVALSRGRGGTPRPLAGCESVPFDPRLGLGVGAPPLAPAGLAVELELPQYESARAAAALSQVRLELPAGLSLAAPAAAGLQGCPPDAIGLTSAPGAQPPSFDAGPAACPASSHLGSLTLRTPLIDHPLGGQVYLAEPGANPFGARFALYLAIEDPATGTILKLPGLLEPDPAAGRLTATFSELPSFPLTDLRLTFDGGPRAVLADAASCGTHTAFATLVPSSAPQGATLTRQASFTVTGEAGQPCPPTEAERSYAPGLEAGTRFPLAGQSTPFLFQVSREDSEQRLGSLDFSLPPGLLPSIARVSTCSDAELAAAAGRSGAAELAAPSCPPTSALGVVRLRAGLGAEPLGLAGSLYLGGPHQGAPFSLVAIVPALAGPFDLGTVVERIAVRLDPRTAQLSARSDPLPQILGGVPLYLRSLALELDRAGLVHNPTSCEPMTIAGSSISSLGLYAPLSERFQAGACAALGFRPGAAVRLLGPPHRGAHPRLRAVLTPRPGDANLRRAAVTLPDRELLDSRHIGTTCSAERFAAGRCPAGSIYGKAKAWTPLLGRPLEGPVYLRAGEGRLPELAVSLDGQIHLDLTARVSSVRGRLRIALGALPDAPLSRVVLTMAGGRRGLLVNTGGLCARGHRASVSFKGQNGKRREFQPVVSTDCRKGR